jgi:hypothetical protein
MLVTAWWAYQTTYNVTIQYTPFELVYDIQPIMLTQFVVPTKRAHDLPQKDIDKAIQVRMEDLFRLHEIHWQTKEILTIFSFCAKNKGMKKAR